MSLAAAALLGGAAAFTGAFTGAPLFLLGEGFFPLAGLGAADLGLTTTVGLNFLGGGGMNPATGMGDKSYTLERVLGGIEVYTRILSISNKRAEKT